MACPKIPVIIDTDPGVDDVVAILFALASPEIEILAFIITFGNTDIDSCYDNIFKIYYAVSRHLEAFPDQKSRFPNFFQTVKPLLARGARIPVHGDTHSAQYFHGRDGLGNISERHPDLTPPPEFMNKFVTPTPTNGPQVVLDLLKSHPAGSITYIALGPLSSLTKCLDSTTFTGRIGRIVSMGGALDVPGNTTPVAEFNFFADPFAVRELLHQPLLLDKIRMHPLDITTPHTLPFPVYAESVDPHFGSISDPSQSQDKSPLAHFTSSFLERTREIMLGFGSDAMELHDIVAVWYATQQTMDDTDTEAPGWKTKTRHFDVECIGELTRGMLVVDRRVHEKETSSVRGENRAHAESTRQANEQDPTPTNPDLLDVIAARPGIKVVTGTPGPEKLLELLLQRVWGIEAH